MVAWCEWIVAAAVLIGGFEFGLLTAWPSPAFIPLTDTKQNELVHGPLTDEEFSWAGASLFIGGVVGSLLGAVGVNNLGRRMTLLGAALLLNAAWFLKATAAGSMHIFVARLAGGVASGMIMVAAPMYVAEISRPSIRGALGSLLQVEMGLGVILAYALGPCVPLYWLAWIGLIVSFIWMVSLCLCPESPVYLVASGRRVQAQKALATLRCNAIMAEEEVKAIQPQEVFWLKGLRALCACDSSPAARGLMISCCLVAIQQCTGISVLIMNVQAVFEAGGGTLSPYYSSVLIGVAQLVATLICPIVVDKGGRRLLLLMSSGGMFLSMLSLTAYMWVLSSANDIPEQVDEVHKFGIICQASLVIYFVLFCMGCGPVPWLVMGEVFEADVRPAACAIPVLLMWMFGFIISVGWYYLRVNLGYHVVFFVFSLICVMGFLFILFFVPETKGRTFEQIQQILKSPQRIYIFSTPNP